MEETVKWYKLAEVDELAESRVKSVTAGVRSVYLVRYQDEYLHG